MCFFFSIFLSFKFSFIQYVHSNYIFFLVAKSFFFCKDWAYAINYSIKLFISCCSARHTIVFYALVFCVVLIVMG